MQLKTIVIAHNFDTNSFAAMSHGLAHHLSDNGFRVVYISHFPYFEMPHIIKKNQGEIIVCSWPTKKRPTNFVDFWWFAKLYIKYKPDFVIGHFVGSNIAITVSKILSFGKTKTFEYYHTISGAIITDLVFVKWTQKLLFFRKKIFYSLFCDQIICPSEIAKYDLISFFGCKNTIVISNPVCDRTPENIEFVSKNIIISYLGRLEPTKGVLELINSFQNFQNINPESTLKLQIAGTGSLQSQVLNLVKTAPNIFFFGGINYSDIDNYLKNSHYTIIPSKFDNLPTVGIESLMNARPLLISNTTGLTALVTDNVNGFKFDCDQNGFFDIFNKAETNESKYNDFCKNARLLYEKEFTMNRYFKAIKTLL